MNTNQTTGYPSIDKPWLKYYSDEAINAKLPNCSMYENTRGRFLCVQQFKRFPEKGSRFLYKYVV